MAFPTSPTNGQLTTVNGINYQYSSSDNAWKRVIVGYDVFAANSLSIAGNANIGNVSAIGFYFANGTPFVSSTYGNTEVAAYLGPYYTYANANATTQTTYINSVNANLISFQTWANLHYSTGGGGGGGGLSEARAWLSATLFGG